MEPSDALKRIGEQFHDVAHSAGAAFAEQSRKLEESLARFAGLVDLSPLSDPVKHLVDGLERQQRQIHNILIESDRALRKSESDVRLLAQCGWTLPMWGEPNFAVNVMNEAGRDPPNVAEIDAAFEQHYTESGGAAFDGIAEELLSSEGLSPWRVLLTECVSAYRRNEFNVPIPALFTVLEGGAVAVAGTPAATGPVRPMRAAADESKHTIEFLIRVSLLDFLIALFASSDFAKGEPPRANRHWVLHGRSRRLFTRLDCIRLFHALHTLSHETNRELNAKK